MISTTQIPKAFKYIIDEEIEYFKESPSITEMNSIPNTSIIPLDNKTYWIKIKDVICVFADIKNSTKICADNADKISARSVKLFTETVTKIFHETDSPYIDIKGDGVFALFNSWEPHRALASAVIIKTFCIEEFIPRVVKISDADVGVHIGIDQHTLLVRKCGLRFRDRTDRQNEVWAGKTVNMAAKLASLTDNNEILASDRFFYNLKDDKAIISCGCGSGGELGEPTELWESIEIDNDKFDFNLAYRLASKWCRIHGEEYCNHLLFIDKK